MSRIGRLPIRIPEGVKVEYKDRIAVVEGPKGKLTQRIDFDGYVELQDGLLFVRMGKSNDKARYGLARALLNNMVVGITQGFKKTLKIVGVGYKAQLQGKNLVLNLGYSHPINYPIPEGIKIEVPDQNTIIVEGIDKQKVGQVAAEIRAFRKPEPYKGKGVMYVDEHIRRKAGKAGA
ncbi:MAG: 50S ribosomal protein L6 [Spirochaetes bacterium]|nr:MAG: 50S ribosomal protein L6 [Spirochaetota bacterium]